VIENERASRLRWEFMFDDFDLRAWAHLRPERSASQRNAELRVPMFSQVS
jgi:hypothetical protein